MVDGYNQEEAIEKFRSAFRKGRIALTMTGAIDLMTTAYSFLPEGELGVYDQHREDGKFYTPAVILRGKPQIDTGEEITTTRRKVLRVSADMHQGGSVNVEVLETQLRESPMTTYPSATLIWSFGEPVSKREDVGIAIIEGLQVVENFDEEKKGRIRNVLIPPKAIPEA